MKTSSSDHKNTTKNLEIMKQPALGIKISELRKSKGLTQEELVEQCNISVRTIQRIEAGEVTPRSYTIKTILSALDYDLSKIQTENSSITQEFKKLLLLDVDDSKEADFLTHQLSISWISGIVYFVLGFGEFAMDFFRHFQGEMITNNIVYTVIKLIILISIILFYRGFILTGKLFKNYLLRITAFIFVFISCIFYTYDILSLYIGTIDPEFILGAEAVTFGVIGILFGISVLRLKNALGTIATATGIFEIITYACFVTIFLSVVGMVLLTPTVILEIILLYKVSQMLKAKQKEFSAS